MMPYTGRYFGLESARRIAVCLALPLALAAATAGARPAHAEGNIIIKDFVLTHEIEEREPTDMVEGFTPADDKAVAFARIFNDGPPAELTAVWMYEGGVHASVGLNVGTSSGWRTWSSANLKPGEWIVQLRDAEGVILAERSFAVESEFAQDDAAVDMAPAAATFDDEAPRRADDWPELEGSAYPRSGDIDG